MKPDRIFIHFIGGRWLVSITYYVENVGQTFVLEPKDDKELARFITFQEKHK